ncbi:hypothetical protein BH10ACI4_BH10ACI4_39030 [soil metagenome]
MARVSHRCSGNSPHFQPMLRAGLLFLASAITCQTSMADTGTANAALQRGRVDEAATMLRATLVAQPHDALTHQLLCRVFYTQDLADQAIHECEQAVADAPQNSENHLWLGRAYGLKAGQVSPFSAFGMAKKVRDEFERAVQLDPNAPRAASDLGQFYINAPGIVGGGTDKATALIERIEPQFPVYSHRLRALLAEKKKDFTTAEAEFKNAIAAGKSKQQTAPAWIDLADFYQRRKQPDQALSAIKSALALNPKGPELVDAASILTQAHQSPELAERLLREYLASTSQTDESPVFKAHVQLGDLLKSRGDKAGARTEYEAALALATSYTPARKALQGL